MLPRYGMKIHAHVYVQLECQPVDVIMVKSGMMDYVNVLVHQLEEPAIVHRNIYWMDANVDAQLNNKKKRTNAQRHKSTLNNSYMYINFI